MSRLMTIGLVSALLVCGGCKKNSLPDMPEPEARVQNIDFPSEIGETQRDADWVGLVEYFNATNGGLSRVAANIDQLGDKASAELKSGLDQVVSTMNEIRGKVMGARESGSLDAIRKEIEGAAGSLEAIRNQLVP